MATRAAETTLPPRMSRRLPRGGPFDGLMVLSRKAIAALLIPLTIAGTTIVAALPFAWILIVSKLIEIYELPPIIAVPALIVAIPASMIAGLKLLLRVSDLYERLRGNEEPRGRVAPVWRRGLTDTQQAKPVRMLDIVMVITACMAILALCVWFIAFAGTTVKL